MVLASLVDTGLSSSIVGNETKEALVESSCDVPNQESRLDRRTTWGVYCVYMAIGCTGDFFVTFLAAPTLCQYVFGPMGNEPGDHTTVGQCNVAPSVFQMSWNFKLFFGFFLDIVPFFKSRRKGWILFGWTGGLAMLGINALFVDYFVENHQFDMFLYSLMLMCFFYTFSDVAADGMLVELSKLEPESQKGTIMTNSQMCRFTMMMVSTAFGTLAMSGPSYQPPGKPAPGALVLPFELPLSGVLWMIFAIAVPFYVGMWIWLRDPPIPEEHQGKGKCEIAKEAGKHVWTAMKSFAVFMLLLQCYGIQALANLMNPANQAIASISKPTTIQTGIGAVIGNLSLVLGIWIFKRFFLKTNWRSTLFMSEFFLALASALGLMSIYDTWGISRNGWFYMFSANLPSLIQGIGRVVSSLAIVEISPRGLEATIYELLVSANNGAISLNTALQSIFAAPFKLEDISSVTWEAHPEMVPTYQNRLMLATVFSLIVNISGAAVFMWCLPKDPEQCRAWAQKKSWHKNWAAALNLVIFAVPFVYANYTVLSFVTAAS